jgi:threonine dehydrogenase-like Zn-dependent dehydrogenase
VAALYREREKDLPVTRDVDVVVVGGGPAGLAAAVSSARNGAATVLVERFPYLGGTATASLMACINGFRNQVEPDERQVIRGIPEEIVLEMKRLGGLHGSHYKQKRFPTEPGKLEYSYNVDTEKLKYVTLKMAVDAGVDLLFHTWFSAPIVEDGAVRGVIAENKSGRQALLARVVVDASGDADVAARAGAPYRDTDRTDPKSCTDNLMYRIELAPDRAGRASAQELPPCCDFGGDVVVWGPYTSAPVDGADGDSLARGEVDARQRVFEHFAALQAKYPGLAGARLVETPPLLGIRQTRFIVGDYVLTAEDVLEGRKFDDGIAVCVNVIFRYFGYRRYLDHDGYDIPYRCLLPRGVEGLLVAGRCMSGDHIAFESWRGMVIMMAAGQAAGAAAALAAKAGVTPRRLEVARLQETLRRQGAVVRHRGRYLDPIPA